MIEDRYGNGRFLRQWSLDEEGRPVCLVDALDTTTASPAQILAVEQANAEVRAALGEAEPPPPALTLDDYEAAIDMLVQSTARTRNYADAASCASYALDPDPVWAAEAMAFIIWRSAVWKAVCAALAAVEAGEMAPPSIAELIASLPGIEWPAPVKAPAP